VGREGGRRRDRGQRLHPVGGRLGADLIVLQAEFDRVTDARQRVFDADFHGRKPTDILVGLHCDLSGILLAVVSSFFPMGSITPQVQMKRGRGQGK
jgi:hypothetical protein